MPVFDFTFDDRIIRGVDVIIQGGLDALDFEGGQEAVVDAFFEGVDINRLAEIFVGIDIVFAFGCGGETELHGRREIFHDGAPVAFVVGAAAVTFVDDDEVEDNPWDIRQSIGVSFGPLMKVWKMVKKILPLVGTLPSFADLVRFDADEGIFGEGGEGVECLVGQNVSVGQKQDAGSA